MENLSIHPETADRLTRGLNAGFLLVAIGHSMAATNHWLSSALLARAGDVVMPIGIIVVLLNCYRMAKSAKGTDHESPFDSESFVMQSFQRSCMFGFMVGFLTLNILKLFDDKLLAGFVPEFFMQTTLATMLGTVAICFFFLNREPAAG